MSTCLEYFKYLMLQLRLRKNANKEKQKKTAKSFNFLFKLYKISRKPAWRTCVSGLLFPDKSNHTKLLTNKAGIAKAKLPESLKVMH